MAAGDLPPLIPRLPDDVSARIIAFLPLSSHPSISLVSRSWRSLLSSPHLFHLRSLLPSPYPVLLLSFRTPSSPSVFLFFPSPSSSPLPLSSPPLDLSILGSAAAPLGPVLHLVGGSLGGVPSRSLLSLDLRSRLWSQGPTMSSAREFPAAAVISGRLFAIGGCLPSSRSWAESLLLSPPSSAPRWSHLPSPFHLRDKWIHASAVLSGKILAVSDRGGVVLDPETLSWSPVSSALDLGWKGRAVAVEGVLYTYDYLGKVKGYDPGRDEWRQVEGLEGKLPRFLCGATLAGLGRVLCLVWEEKGKGRRRDGKVDVACAGIEVSRTEDGGLKGKVAWMELAALAVPKGSAIVHCVGMEL